MRKFARIINEKTKQVDVLLGNIDAPCLKKYANAIGFSEMNVEESDEGRWYLMGYIPEPTAEEKATAEIVELKQKLSETDYAVIKIAEGAATPEDYADIIAKRAVWRSRINELEAKLAAG